jgi:hypothetical protein
MGAENTYQLLTVNFFHPWASITSPHSPMA